MDPLLTEITLEGFKSFRDKTTLKFDGPFTAVVGPNGSGKSNVVDAIKWVLGDPSPRSIRASTGLEAIYQPAEGNGNGAGFCSVAIRIDNSSPANEEEPSAWEIERRYYRSGESVYTLNGKTARLRDIRSILGAKGFGLGNLSVVSQGEIDGFLSLVPSDRRLVFEDLARISDFKTNKRKILSQLDESARNHQRLQDLVGEITIRVDKLTVQAEDARRHAELNEQKFETEAKLASQEYLLARKNVERNETRLNGLNGELENAKNDRNSSVEALARAKVDLEQARTENADTIAECEKGRRELDRSIAEERRLTEANQHLSTLVGTLETDLSERETRIDSLKSRQGELRNTETNAWTEQRHALRRKLDLDFYLSRRRGYLRSSERERERLVSRVERLQGEGSFFARDAEFHTRRAESLEGDIEQLIQRETEINTETGTIQSELSGLETELESLDESRNLCEKEAGTLRNELDSIRLRLDAIERAKSDLSAEISGLKRERVILREMEKSGEGYDEGVKAILDRRGEIPGLHGTIGEHITVESGYEAKFELALGDSIGFLVCDKIEDALDVIELAKTENYGPVTCVVLDLLSDFRSKSETGLFSHCTSADNIRPVINTLLCGTTEVETLRNIESSRLSEVLISSDGGVFRPPAFVSGGGDRREASGILSRRARIEEIEKSLTRTQWSLASLNAEFSSLDIESERKMTTLQTVHESLEELRGKIREQELSVTAHEKKLGEFEKELSDILGRTGELKSECDGCRENALLASQGIEAVRRARTESEHDLERLESGIPGINDQVEDLRSRLQRAIVEEASYREEASRAHTEIDRLSGEIGSVEIEITERRDKLEKIREDARGMSRDLDAATDLRRNLEKTLPELEEKEKEARSRISELGSHLANLEDTLEESRENVDSVEQSVHSQEIRLAELRGGLASLDKGLDEFPEFAEQIRAGALSGKDIPSKKELNEILQGIILDLEELGNVNPLAIEEERMARERLDELDRERADLITAEEELRQALEEVERQSEKAFTSTFAEARERFREVFAALFPGGTADLKLTDPDDPLESGIDVKVKFPGKGELDLLQFSGGERSLIAIALLFAILKVKPSSFTLLDEVEAALDDVNTLKFLDYLGQEFSDRQFIMITHNKITMERANRLYGVTMHEGGVSQIVSVDLTKLKEQGVDKVLGNA